MQYQFFDLPFWFGFTWNLFNAKF